MFNFFWTFGDTYLPTQKSDILFGLSLSLILNWFDLIVVLLLEGLSHYTCCSALLRAVYDFVCRRVSQRDPCYSLRLDFRFVAVVDIACFVVAAFSGC